MKKRGFTLVEMLIVIVIIAILLALTLGISGNRIQTLKNKYIQEQFTYTYNSIFSRNLLTSYYNGQTYSKVTIHLTGGENKISYCYLNKDGEACDIDNVQGGKYLIKTLSFSGSHMDFNSADIVFKPYVLGCELLNGTNTGEILKIKMTINNNQDYCVKINENLCKLEKIDCESM